jgi:hypothetical protein
MNEQEVQANEASEKTPVIIPDGCTTERTRVFKKRIAPAGKIFFVIRYKVKGKEGATIYTNHALMSLGSTLEQEQEVFETLWEGLKNKFNL